MKREIPLLRPQHEWQEIPDPKTIDSIKEIDAFLVEWSNRKGEYQRHLGLFLDKDGEKKCGRSTQPELDALLERRHELVESIKDPSVDA